ncbi:hypothetical protein [Flavihumibacter profundi]|uniref:hypothetical protein n=1 Tax=Flavihumibacter profundi TaxID=2716883 RepID=UPI001CC3B38E|nr:hypothetical protein [Flavihumibacter profundi]MBZ5858545.1 hypothetical protein [Flavihumibacter profundi]
MKNILLIWSFFVSYASFSQGKIDEYKKMIDSAIIIQNSLHSSTPGERVIHLVDENNNPYILILDKDQQNFKSIAIFSKENRRLIKKGIRAWKVFPVLIKNKLVVTIIDYYITYKNKNYNFANGGGAKVIFEYSCDQEKWIFVSSNWSGI